jgi:hypothetical protein
LSKLTHALYFGKKYPKILGYFSTFIIIALSKQSPIEGKIAQSGHPGSGQPKKTIAITLPLQFAILNRIKLQLRVQFSSSN